MFRRPKAIHVPVDEPLSRALLKKLIYGRISQCPVKQGTVDVSKYSSHDGYWRHIGLAAPARRGLIDDNLFDLRDLRRLTQAGFRNIHKVGSRAEAAVLSEMKCAGIRFNSGR